MEIQPLRKRPHILSLHDRLDNHRQPHGVEDQVSLRWGRDLLRGWELVGMFEVLKARPCTRHLPRHHRHPGEHLLDPTRQS